MENNSKKPVYIAIFGAILFFILALFSFRTRTAVRAETLFHSAAAPVLAFTDKVTDTVSDFMERVFFPSAIQEENNELKKQIVTYERKLLLFDEISRENARLTELLDYVEQNPDMRYLTASIIAKSVNASSQSITLNVGTRHGVTVKTPVVTGDGVIGRVTEVGNSWCKVHTLMNDEMRLSVLIDRTREEGTLGGFVRTNGEVSGLKLYYLPDDADIRPGDKIVTSSSGGVFPKGLYVGTVLSLNEEENASYNACVMPDIDFEHLENVLLILGMDEAGYD